MRSDTRYDSKVSHRQRSGFTSEHAAPITWPLRSGAAGFPKSLAGQGIRGQGMASFQLLAGNLYPAP